MALLYIDKYIKSNIFFLCFVFYKVTNSHCLAIKNSNIITATFKSLFCFVYLKCSFTFDIIFLLIQLPKQAPNVPPCSYAGSLNKKSINSSKTKFPLQAQKPYHFTFRTCCLVVWIEYIQNQNVKRQSSPKWLLCYVIFNV